MSISVWDKYIGSNVTPVIINESQFISEEGNIHVFNVIFDNLKPYGAISINNSAENSVLISNSVFISCSSMNNGGSINIIGGECIQYHICSINSLIPMDQGYGCHSFVCANGNNYIIESSIFRFEGKADSIYVLNGNQLIDSTNISNGKCKIVAAYNCEEISDSNKVNFTSIVNNTSEEGIIFHNDFFLNENSHFITHCNIMKNVQKTSDDGNNNGIITSHSCNLYVEFCVLLLNSGTALFGNLLYDFKFYVKDCYIADNNVANLTTHGNVSISSTQSFELNISYFVTHKCSNAKEIEMTLLVLFDQATLISIINIFLVILLD